MRSPVSESRIGARDDAMAHRRELEASAETLTATAAIVSTELSTQESSMRWKRPSMSRACRAGVPRCSIQTKILAGALEHDRL
jgi:hypothetical protein